MNKIYERGVELVVSALIENKKGEILLIKSHKWHPDQYLLPGGHVESGERIIDAVKREGEEETGLRLEPLHCLTVGEFINSPLFNRKAHLVYFDFLCKTLTEEVKLDKQELKTFIWVTPEEALKLPLISGVEETIQKYIDKKTIAVDSFVF